MFLFVVILILMSVFIIQNKKLKDSTKNAWFVFLAIIIVFFVIFEIL